MSVDNLSTENGPTFLVRDLRPATTYICEVKAENDVGLSEPSNSINFTTDEQGDLLFMANQDDYRFEY
jgi:fibronectin type III domain